MPGLPTHLPVLLVDRHIPYRDELFGRIGTVIAIDPADFTRSYIDQHRPDALIVRSVTRVDSALIEGSSVKWVGSPTTGDDHLDCEGLKSQGIPCVTAAGCNADAVVQWTLAAILHAAPDDPTDFVIGIVGVGRIGTKVAAACRAMRFPILVCDPPRARAGTLPEHRAFIEVLKESHLITVHVPAIASGEDQTVGMLNGRAFIKMRPQGWLVNAARGPIIDWRDYHHWGVTKTIVDVFPGEPNVRGWMLRSSTLATPHLAGYSKQAKMRGAWMVAVELANSFGMTERLPPMPSLPKPASPVLDWPGGGTIHAMRELVRATYDIAAECAECFLGVESHETVNFEPIRAARVLRDEPCAYTVRNVPAESIAAVRAAGFTIAAD